MIREHNKTFEEVPVMFSNNYFVRVNNSKENNLDNNDNENKNSVELNA